MPESLSLSVTALVLLVVALVPLAFAGGWLLRAYLTRASNSHVDDFMAEERRVQDMIKRLREEVAAPATSTAPAAWSPPREHSAKVPVSQIASSAPEPEEEDAESAPHAHSAPSWTRRDPDHGRFDDDGEIEVDVSTPPIIPRPVVMRAALVLLVVGATLGVVWLEGLRRSDSNTEWSLRAGRALSSLPGAPEATFASDIPAATDAQPSMRLDPPSDSLVTSASLTPSTADSEPTPGSGATPAASTPAAVATPPENSKTRAVPAGPTPAAIPVGPGEAPTVTAAELCAPLVPLRDTNKWRCDKPSDSSPGNYFYYTRIRTSRGTVVRHRWFRDDILQQNIELRVESSGPEGYRTYSRLPIGPDGKGNWRVELLDASDRVLHEARLVVR